MPVGGDAPVVAQSMAREAVLGVAPVPEHRIVATPIEEALAMTGE
ncbi:hypothetical protein [Actinophytocola glycyrrhizae]|uniref:Uncharacterized protein n=1 Tax=Actinophytocola glycyrrhizae TaxID=2044873 RepID=A0ABV9RZS3_9PSEU